MPITRSQLQAVQPERVVVTTGGRAWIRLAGTVCGWVCLGGQRRFRWGAFDDWFGVDVADRPLTAMLIGIGGIERRRIETRPRRDLMPASVSVRVAVASTTPPPPRARRLRASPPRAARILGLDRRAAIQRPDPRHD